MKMSSACLLCVMAIGVVISGLQAYGAPQPVLMAIAGWQLAFFGLQIFSYFVFDRIGDA